jgi:hypothetical protein
MLRRSTGFSSGANRVVVVMGKVLWCASLLKAMCVACARFATASDGPEGVAVLVRMGGFEDVMLRRRL